jgi:hypothetical protein
MIMSEENVQNYQDSFGEELLSWEIPEYSKYQRGTVWYISAVVVTAGLLFYALYDHNYLFALIIVMFLIISIFINTGHEAKMDFVITTMGIGIGEKFYDYEAFHSFSVIYKPQENLKMLYLEFGSVLRPRASISLTDVNPLAVREILMERIPEDLDRTDEPHTDFFAKKLKL